METYNLKMDVLEDEIDRFPVSLKDPISKYNYEKLVSLLTNKELEAFTGQGEVEVAQQICREYEKTIKLSRQLDFASASDVYQAAEMKTEDIHSSIVYLYIKQHALSTKAYYFYKQGKYTLAKAITIECINIVDYLVKQGCYSLRYRCLGQNENIAKLDFLAGNWQQAGHIFGNMLVYLSKGYSEGLIGEFLTDQSYSKKYAALDEAFLYITFNIGVRHLIHFAIKQEDEEGALFKLLFGTSFSPSPSGEFSNVISYWLDTKQAYFDHQYADFLARLVEFVNEPMSKDFDFLKLSLMHNLISYTKTHVSDEQKRTKILTKIRFYITTKLLIQDETLNTICRKTFV